MSLAAAPALAQTQVNVTDPRTPGQRRAVDVSGNGAVAAKAVTSGGVTTGPSTTPCTGMIPLPTGVSTTPVVDYCGSAAAHQVYTIELDNTLNQNSSIFLIYDLASPSPGTSTAVGEIGVPGGVVEVIPLPIGWAFSNQIALACATAYNGNTATKFNCSATVWFK